MKNLRFLLADIHCFTSKEAQQLLHNKFVVVVGDSNYRAIYKDLVYILQTDKVLTLSQLKQKDEESFANDCRVEFNGPHSRNDYRLVRQYRTCHHLVRFYFITRVYSPYVESILNDFRAGQEAGLAPDVVILNSCIWDLNRYHDDFPTEPPVPKAIREYRQNAEKLFQALHNILPPSSLVIWSTALPITEDARGYVVEHPHKPSAKDMIEANFYVSNLAEQYWFDVLDLHHRFRFLENLHATDGVHWDSRAHRYITNLLLTHIAEAWQVEVKKRRLQIGIPRDKKAEDQQPSPWRTVLPTHRPCLWSSSPAQKLFNSSRTCLYTRCNAEYKNRPRGRLGQGYQSAQLSGSIQHNGSHISGPNGGVQYEQVPLPYADPSNPRNYFHTQPHDSWPICSSEQHYPHPNPSCYSRGPDHVGYDSRPTCSSDEQEHYPHPNPSYYSRGPDHVGYDSRPTCSSDEQEHYPHPNPSYYSRGPDHVGYDSRPTCSSDEQEHYPHPNPSYYSRGPDHVGYDSRPTCSSDEQEHYPHPNPSYFSRGPDHVGYDSRPTCSSDEQEHYPHPNPSYYSRGPDHVGYDSRPISMTEQDHRPQPSPCYSCAPNSIGYDGRPIRSLEREQCVQSYPSNYSHALQDGRPTCSAEQEARLQSPPNSSSHAPKGAGHASRPMSSTEQEQCRHSYHRNYFHAPRGAGYDSRIIGVPEQALCPPLNPWTDFLVHLSARNGPWPSDADEDNPGFPLHMEGMFWLSCQTLEIHHNGPSVPESLTREEGWATSRLPCRLPQGTWVRSRKMGTELPQRAYSRRRAYAPYAKDRSSARNSC
ncbi:uncharacterized protein LOC134502219 [Candoia aspera]|uniref:uncharacterized protein LOC134502219 n=1 Tax=Candoia aspera TaxID=51853 RepID=UPI002FD82073